MSDLHDMLMWGDNPDGRDELEQLRARLAQLEVVLAAYRAALIYYAGGFTTDLGTRAREALAVESNRGERP